MIHQQEAEEPPPWGGGYPLLGPTRLDVATVLNDGILEAEGLCFRRVTPSRSISVGFYSHPNIQEVVQALGLGYDCLAEAR